MSRVSYKRKILSDKTKDDLIYLENEVSKLTSSGFSVGIRVIKDEVVYYINDNNNDNSFYDDNIETLIKVYTAIMERTK